MSGHFKMLAETPQWRRARLEQVYRGAKVYLITLAEDEANNVHRKIENGDVMGLDDCIVASTQGYTDLLQDLKMQNFSLAELYYQLPARSIRCERYNSPKESRRFRVMSSLLTKKVGT